MLSSPLPCANSQARAISWKSSVIFFYFLLIKKTIFFPPEISLFIKLTRTQFQVHKAHLDDAVAKS